MLNVDALIAVREYAEDIKTGVNNAAVSITMCQDIETGLNRALAEIQACYRTKECTVLCKGSHGSEVYKIADGLKKFGGSCG